VSVEYAARKSGGEETKTRPLGGSTQSWGLCWGGGCFVLWGVGDYMHLTWGIIIAGGIGTK